jgi:hypothetical protein
VRVVRRGRDGAAADAERGGDRLVVEVGVVAEKESEPLALGQRCDGRPNCVAPFVARVVSGHVGLPILGDERRARPDVAGG